MIHIKVIKSLSSSEYQGILSLTNEKIFDSDFIVYDESKEGVITVCIGVIAKTNIYVVEHINVHNDHVHICNSVLDVLKSITRLPIIIIFKKHTKNISEILKKNKFFIIETHDELKSFNTKDQVIMMFTK